MSIERLDKLISNISGISRSEIKKMSKQGRVMLNGCVIKDCSVKADSACDTVIIDGAELSMRQNVYIMLNKPKGVVSASEGKGDITVVDILPDELKRKGLFPAGRLDKNTTGFVLITNDGDFAHRILSPKNHIDKTYIASLDTPVDESAVKTLEDGIELKDGTVFKPAKITLLNEAATQALVIIHEGKYHQIKRMFKAVGSEVIELERIKMGNLELDGELEPGQARYLTEEELKRIVG